MTTMHVSIATEGSSTWRQMGNHLFVIYGDMVKVYEGMTYNRFALETVKDLEKTYLITEADNWETIADRFFGTPVAPNFNKAVA